MSQGTLLVIDDEPDVRTAIARGLGRVGYEIVEAESAEEGLEAIERQEFAAAITDLRMPGAGGQFFIRECRLRRPALPIIVISAHGDAQDVIDCLRQGVTDYLVKPWSQNVLRYAVARAVRPAVASPAPPVAPAPPAPPTVEETSKPTLDEILKLLRAGEISLPEALEKLSK